MEANNIKTMREALKQADVLISIATFEKDVKNDEVEKIRDKINTALSAPTCNCDELSKDDVLNGQKRLEIKNECGGNL